MRLSWTQITNNRFYVWTYKKRSLDSNFTRQFKSISSLILSLSSYSSLHSPTRKKNESAIYWSNVQQFPILSSLSHHACCIDYLALSHISKLLEELASKSPCTRDVLLYKTVKIKTMRPTVGRSCHVGLKSHTFEFCQNLKYSGLSLSRTPSITNFYLSRTIFSVPFHWFQPNFLSLSRTLLYLEQIVK